MISLTKSQVPENLKGGDFYKNLQDDEDDGDDFCVSEGRFKANWKIDDDADFARSLSTVEFWMIPVIPQSVVEYAAGAPNPKSVAAALSPFRQNFPPYMQFLQALCNATNRGGEENELKVLKKRKYLHNDAARLCCNQYKRESGAVWNARTSALAAMLRRVDVLKLLHENGCPWDETTCVSAARSNSLECLQYAHENGCPLGDAYSHVRSLRCACAKYIADCGGNVLTAKHCADAAKKVSGIRMLRSLRSAGSPWDATTCREAARVGAIRTLRYACNKGCPVDESVVLAAAAHSLDCLRYLRDKFPLTEGVCVAAAEAGMLNCLSYAHGQSYPWTATTCAAAARANQYECLQYAHENGCPWDATTVNSAAQNGHVACLRFALHGGCPTDADTCVNAVEGGKHCLVLVRYHGCEWDARCCAAAVRVDSRECLDLLLKKGCPYDADLVRIAVREGSRSCLEYLHKHNFPWDGDAAFVAVTAGSLACLQYLHGHGCQWDAAVLLQVPRNYQTRKCLEYVRAHPHPAA
jgi:hypothetical protein